MLNKIGGMKPSVFCVVAVIVLSSLYLDVLPNNMAAGFTVTMVLGAFLAWVGNSIPGFRTFGGAPLLCIIVPVLLAHFHVLPQSGVDIVSHFLTGYGLLDFLVSGLIVGSILSMNREVLVKAGIRFIIPISAAILFAFVFGGIAGHLTGYGFVKAILFIVAPVMGGGIATGVIPMSEIYAGEGGGTSAEYISLLIPAIIVANIVCILTAAVLNGLGKRNKDMFNGFSGGGQILRLDKVKLSTIGKEYIDAPTTGTFSTMAVGIIIAGAIYSVGQLMTAILPNIHAYAWMVIATAFLKIFNWTSSSIEDAAGEWYGFISGTMIPAVLVAVSIGLINLDQLLEAVTNPGYLGITVLIPLVASVGAGIVGWCVGMHYLESSITAGLCMADLAATGDIAVLGASERMHLLPFAQISSRIGGALMLVIMSILIPILM